MQAASCKLQASASFMHWRATAFNLPL
ncbi:MAG: hypothetical protein ACRERY_17115 [Pseudomonas sp.]